MFGGGVSKLPAIHDAVSRALIDEMSGYAIIEEHRGGFVVPPGLGDDAGVSGALALAMDVA